MALQKSYTAYGTDYPESYWMIKKIGVKSTVELDKGTDTYPTKTSITIELIGFPNKEWRDGGGIPFAKSKVIHVGSGDAQSDQAYDGIKAAFYEAVKNYEPYFIDALDV